MTLFAISTLPALAAAGDYSYAGTTVGGPTFNRPVANGNNAPASLSAVGTAVRYSSTVFAVDTAGSYTFQSSGSYDNYTFLYSAFNAASPLSGALIGNDDNPSIGTSGFTYNLLARTAYTFVTTGFANADAGAFTNAFSGPGSFITRQLNPTFGGTTVGGPTFNRPVANGNNAPASLSAVGTAVRYSALTFHTETAGSYTFQTSANYDDYTFLYNSFDASQPLSNVLIGNDDNPSIGTSGFTYTLAANADYTFVTTGFANTDAGTYTGSITGPGYLFSPQFNPVPEPSTLVATFFLGLVVVRRRRR